MTSQQLRYGHLNYCKSQFEEDTHAELTTVSFDGPIKNEVV